MPQKTVWPVVCWVLRGVGSAVRGDYQWQHQPRPSGQDVGYLHHLDLVLYRTVLHFTVQWPGRRISPSPGSRYNYLYLELWSRLDQRLPATNIRRPTWRLESRAANDPSVFIITEKASSRAFFWLKAPSSAINYTSKTLLRRYAKPALTYDIW